MNKTAAILLTTALLLAFWTQTGRAATVTLEWNANTEGDMAGYRIHYGMQPRAEAPYAESVLIQDKSLTRYELSLPPGTYYFALTAFDVNQNESAFSSEVSATVPLPAPPGQPGQPMLVQ